MKVRIERQDDGTFKMLCMTKNELVRSLATPGVLTVGGNHKMEALAVLQTHNKRYADRLALIGKADIPAAGGG